MVMFRPDRLVKNFTVSGSRLTRKTPASYTDGVYMMAGADRPGARTLSKLFMRGQDGLPSLANRTSLLAFFGEYNRCLNSQNNIVKVPT